MTCRSSIRQLMSQYRPRLQCLWKADAIRRGRPPLPDLLFPGLLTVLLNLRDLPIKALKMKLTNMVTVLAIANEASAITCTPNTRPCSELCQPNTSYLCCGASWV